MCNMEIPQNIFTGNYKKIKRFRKDRNTWENRYYLEYKDCHGRLLYVRKRPNFTEKEIDEMFFLCNYEPYRSHRKTMSRFYGIWNNMRNRCNNPNDTHYHRYGGRGIKHDERWKHFSLFYDDMYSDYREDLEIDRIDNNGNYQRDNCRWVTRKENCNNTGHNRRITIDGVTKNAIQWANLYGLKQNTIITRIVKYGWDPVKAVVTPLQKNQYAPE